MTPLRLSELQSLPANPTLWGIKALPGHIASALATLALGLAMLTSQVTIPVLPLAWLFLGLATVYTGIRTVPRWILLPLLLILASAYLAVSVAWSHDTPWEVTLFHAISLTPMLLFVLIDWGPTVWGWISGLWLAAAGLTLYHGIALHQQRASGLTGGPNTEAGFLALGIVYLLTTKFFWLAVPLLMALAFTGSRAAILAWVIVMVAMVLFGACSWRRLALVVLVVLVAVSPFWSQVAGGYRILIRAPQRMLSQSQNDIQARLQPFHQSPPESAPRELAWSADRQGSLLIEEIGLVGSGHQAGNGIHNIPYRIWRETGLLAALAWLAITGGAIRQGYGASRWMMLTIGLVGLLDYYFWQPVLMGFWWLAVGHLIKTD